MKEQNSIEVEHVYAHPPAAVWKELTDPELRARWWSAGDVRPIVTPDLGWQATPADQLGMTNVWKHRSTWGGRDDPSAGSW